MLTDRALLRLHIEAVWGVKLPLIERQDIELAEDSARPAWQLCVAELASEHIQIWRPDVTLDERPELLACVHRALSLPPT
ncbi:MAG: hypothetical protein J2P37_30700, partial [Ktedonobacteraceae bacterium]|nr:hypothetical protein [Ktedonobacteraceae bacterium]